MARPQSADEKNQFGQLDPADEELDLSAAASILRLCLDSKKLGPAVISNV